MRHYVTFVTEKVHKENVSSQLYLWLQVLIPIEIDTSASLLPTV